MSDAFRTSPGHAQDIRKIMDALSQRSADLFISQVRAGNAFRRLSGLSVAARTGCCAGADGNDQFPWAVFRSMPSACRFCWASYSDDCRFSSPADAAALTGVLSKANKRCLSKLRGSSGSDGGWGKNGAEAPRSLHCVDAPWVFSGLKRRSFPSLPNGFPGSRHRSGSAISRRRGAPEGRRFCTQSNEK